MALDVKVFWVSWTVVSVSIAFSSSRHHERLNIVKNAMKLSTSPLMMSLGSGKLTGSLMEL